MPKAHVSSTLLQGVVALGSNANPPVFGPIVAGQAQPLYSLQWKTGLQGWTYFQESVIDVTGLTTTQDESLFFSGVDVQQPYPIQAETTPAQPYGSAIYEYFFVTDRKMTREEFQESVGPSSAGNGSGVSFAASPVDQQSLIFGFSRAYESYTVTNLTATTLNLREMWQSNYGVARSTAASKLYCYHCAWSYTGTGGGFGFTITIPDTRFMVSYVSDKEKDLVYMQRLKRSYELQNELV